MNRNILNLLVAVSCMVWVLSGVAHAVMAPPVAQYTITSKASKGGSVTPAGKTVVSAGDKFSIAVAANPGYYLADVVVDGVSEGAIPSRAFESVAANHTLLAKFQKNPVIVATANAGGHISPAGQISVPYGTGQSFTIEPDKGFHLVSVTVDGVDEGVITERTFTEVIAKHQIKAKFAVNTYQLSSSIGETGGGSIMPAAVTAKHGTSKVITVKADKGYVIGRVSVNGIAQEGFAGKTLAKFNPKSITEDLLITASFIPATIVDGVSYLPAMGSEYLPLDAVNVLTGEPTPLYWRYQIAPMTYNGVGITFSALTTYSPVTMEQKDQLLCALSGDGVKGTLNVVETTTLVKESDRYYLTGMVVSGDGKATGWGSYKSRAQIAIQSPYLEYFPARVGLGSYSAGYSTGSTANYDLTATVNQNGKSQVVNRSDYVQKTSQVVNKYDSYIVQGKTYYDVIEVIESSDPGISTGHYWLAKGIGIIKMSLNIDVGLNFQDLVMELVDTNLTLPVKE